MMQIGPKKTAKIIYSISIVEEDKPEEELTVDQSATFQFGTNQLLPAFETKLTGLTSGQDFDFIIKAKDAYGPIDPYAIFDIPKDTFEVDGQIDEKMLKVGNLIPMYDNDGNEHLGKILNVLETAVTLDFNHQLAGKDLRFKGKIIEITSI